jgi:CheY-like chemotaxis protein
MTHFTKKICITVADDDLDDQYLLKEALKATGVSYEVNSVYNGLQLMDFLLKREAYSKTVESPDFIFLDLNMPLMDGFAVLREIRNHPNLKRIPIYLISTSKNDYDALRAIELGARAYHVKPTKFTELTEILHSIFEDVGVSNRTPSSVWTDKGL